MCVDVRMEEHAVLLVMDHSDLKCVTAHLDLGVQDVNILIKTHDQDYTYYSNC